MKQLKRHIEWGYDILYQILSKWSVFKELLAIENQLTAV